jgi:Flp pilus assembly protein CpaB
MRASTLFALTAAVVIGLSVATVAKYAGYFGTPPVASKQEIQVLVAARNLFAGDTIDASGVKTRALRPDEIEGWQKAKELYLPPVVQAAALRIAQKNIYADQPILKSDLKDMIKPDPLNMRLVPNMRAINVSVPKERSAGGLIQIGEWVDVIFTSEVENDRSRAVRTACIAPKVRVISKRNTLWPIFAPLPENKPVDFTLEVNSYRAALIELARTKGDLTLAPLASSEQRVLEVQRDRLLQNPPANPQAHFLDPDSQDAKDEEGRVAAFNRGEVAVSEADLVRVFGLTTLPPPLATVSVERVIGASRVSPVVFSASGVLLSDGSKGMLPVPSADPQPGGPALAAPTFQFRTPDCPTCGNKGKKAY